MLVASPLEVWDVTKVWTLIAKCIAEARVVEDLFVQPGGRRELATVLATFENAWRG